MTAEAVSPVGALLPDGVCGLPFDEAIEQFYVLNDTGNYERVRKHQLEPRHTHYYDDERCVWCTVAGSE